MRHQVTDRMLPTHQLFTEGGEDGSLQRFGKHVGQLLLGVDLDDLDAISTILDVGAKPVNLAIVELRAGSVLAWI